MEFTVEIDEDVRAESSIMESSSEDLKASIMESSAEIEDDVKAAALGLMKKIVGKNLFQCGDHYELVMEVLHINQYGRFSMAKTRSFVGKGCTILEDVPPITVRFSREMTRDWTYEGLKKQRGHILNLVGQAIKHAPKEIHDSYKRAYWKAKEEYKRYKHGVDAPAPELDEAEAPASEVEEATDDFKQMIRDEHLARAKIKVDDMMKAAQNQTHNLRDAYNNAMSAQIKAKKMITISRIKAEKLNKAYKNVVVSDQLDVLPSIVFDVKSPSEEALEKHIIYQHEQSLKAAEKVLQRARERAEWVINVDKLYRGVKRKSRTYIDDDEAERMEIFLGFKDQESESLKLPITLPEHLG